MKTPFPKSALEALGIPADSKLEEGGEVQARPSAVGHGFSAEPRASQADVLAGTMSPILVPNAPLRLEVSASDVDPKRYLVRHRGAEARFIGDGRQLSGQGGFLLDTAKKPAFVRISGWHKDVVVALDSGTVAWCTVGRRPEVSVNTLAADQVREGWLMDEVRALWMEGTPFRRTCAAGLLCRLWTAEASDRSAARAAILGGKASPSTRAHAWFSELPAENRDKTLTAALGEAKILARSWKEVAEAIDESREKRSALLLAAALRRDDLESVAEMYRPPGAGGTDARLDAALRSADEAAACHRVGWAGVRMPLSERLRTVSWVEPDALWAAPEFLS